MRPSRLYPPTTSAQPRTGHVRAHALRTQVAEHVHDSITEMKPHLRGWLHLGILPLTLVGGIVLVVLSPDTETRAGSAVFTVSALLLFGVSAAYHCGTWSPRTWFVLRRLDHCNIFLLVAGSCTAYALLLLDGHDSVVMLSIVWTTALLGVTARFVWPHAPRWLSPPLYVAAGWGALLFVPGLIDGAAQLGGEAGGATLFLLAAGGALYVTGAVVYFFQRPDPWPRWFGFHEVFHAFTVLAFVSHYAGVSVATLSMR